MVSPTKQGVKMSPPSAPSHPRQNPASAKPTTGTVNPAAISPDMSDDESGPRSANSWHGQDHEAGSPAGGGADSDHSDDDNGDSGQGDAPSLPVQKRRRVTRACDECRRKKIKCDGKQPCTHCSVYSYECTYDKPSNRRRNPAPQYIEALESRLERAETLLRKFIPDVDLADPSLDPAVQQEFRNRGQARAKLRQEQGVAPEKEDAQLLSMIESIGQLDIDDKGGWDFHGTSSGAVFLRRMKEHFQGMLGPQERVPFLPRPERPPGLINLDSPQSAGSSPFDSTISTIPELPPKEVARTLCYYSLNCATCLIRIVHVPTFYEWFDRIYEKAGESLTSEETRYLGLLYAVMALGCMYNSLDETVTPATPYRESLEDGLKYYNYARHLLNDLTECRDLSSLQALLFMILFLQATSNLSGCYAFIGIALRSALRIGLHRHLQHEHISPIEQEVRRRVFYVIRQMDIYVSALLGFPLLLNNEDVDQLYPSEVDDEYITKDAILPQPAGVPSFFQAFNAHTRLMETLAKIIKYVYPMKGLGQSVMRGDTPNTTYLISYARIKEIEAELHQWFEELPEEWRPSPEGSIEVIRVRHLLRFAYAHVQLVLYRPFLHYVSPRLSMSPAIDDLSYACAAAAISVSRNIIHIGLEIRKQAVLIGPYWFMLYTEFFAVLSLVFYAIENPEKPGSGDVLGDAAAGRDMIEAVVGKSIAADRVAGALRPLFEGIPDRLRAAKARPVPTKKRSAHSEQLAQMQARGPPTMRTGMAQRASIDIGMAQNGLQQQATRSSFDGIEIPENPFQDPAFSAALQDLLPMNMASRATPESTSTAGGSHRPSFESKINGHNPLNKLDSLMFPSDDPFAYPNQPMMELGFQHGKRPTTQHSDSSQQFFMGGAFEDIEGQLLGQVTPFVMQEHAQRGLNVGVHAYGSPAMAGLSQGLHRGGHHPGRRVHIRQPHEREIEQMLAQQGGYQQDWGGIFGRGTYQGL